MSRFTKQITSYWQQFRTVVRNEYGSIFTDAGVILVLVLALLIYSTLIRWLTGRRYFVTCRSE